jgi:cysteine synthase
MAACIMGFKTVFCMPDKVAREKITLLKAYGAEVVVCPTAVAPDSPESYYQVARKSRASGRTRSSPTSTTIPRTRPRTTARPAPRSGSRPRAGSRTT